MTHYAREKKLALDEARIFDQKTTQNAPNIFQELISSTKTPKETFDGVVSDMLQAVGKPYTPAKSPIDRLHEPPEGSIFNPKTDPQPPKSPQNPDSHAAAKSWSADTWPSAWGPGEKPPAWGTGKKPFPWDVGDPIGGLADSNPALYEYIDTLMKGGTIPPPEKSAVPRKDEEPLPSISGRKKATARRAAAAAISGDFETSRKEAEKYDALDAADPNKLTAEQVGTILSTTGHKFINSVANSVDTLAYTLFSASGAAQRVEQDKRRIAAGMPGPPAASPFDQMAYSFYTWKDPLKEGELLTDRMWAIEEAMRRGEPVTYPQAVLDLIDKKRAEAGEGLEGWRKWVYEGGIGLADLATTLAVAQLSAGGTAAKELYLLLDGLSAGGNAANSARQKGASPEEQLGYGAAVGVSEALVESLTAIGGSEYARRFGGELLQKLPPDVSVWISRNFLADNPAGRVVRGAFGEAMEEGLLYDVNYLAQNIFLDPDTPYEIREKLRQMLYSGVAGGTYRLGAEVGFGSMTPGAGQAGALEFDYDAAARYYDMQNLTRDQLVLFGSDTALQKLKTPAERRAYIRRRFFPQTAESKLIFEHAYPSCHAPPVDLNSPEAQKLFAEFDTRLYTDFAVMPPEQRAYEIGRLLGAEEAGAPPAPKTGASIPAYLKTIDGKVGGKVPVRDYQAIRTASVKNPDADSITLGKYRPTVVDGVEDWTKPGPDSYIARAGDGSSYFDLGIEWAAIKEKYGMNDQEMFEYFNKPVLEDAIAEGKTIYFSHNPLEYPDTFLDWEWEYIKKRLLLTDQNLKRNGEIWYVR